MKESLSQRKLLEILTHEIEVLRKTTKNIHEVAPTIDDQLKKIKETELKTTIDIEPLETLIKSFYRNMKSYMVIPRWFMIFTIVTFTIMGIQSIWLYFKVFAR